MAGKETVHLSKHRVVMHLRKGGLHRALGIPPDQEIPQEKKEEAARSKNPHLAEMGRLAVAMSHWHHGK